MNATLTEPRTQGSDPVPKKKNGKPSTPRPGRSKVPLYVDVDPALRKAVDVAVARERRTLSVLVSIALESYLGELGLWPPPVKPAGTQ